MRVALGALDDVLAQWRAGDLLDVIGGDVIQCAAVLGPRVPGPIGLWLRCGDDYPASLAARDVASVAHLVEVERVVIEAPTHPREHAAIVRAMLESDRVTLRNEAGEVRDARNRPRSPSPIEILAYVDSRLEVGERRLRGRTLTESGQLLVEEYA